MLQQLQRYVRRDQEWLSDALVTEPRRINSPFIGSEELRLAETKVADTLHEQLNLKR